jgi:hypothetical protein
MDNHMLDILSDNDHLLALSLSASPPSTGYNPSFTVQLKDDGIDFSIRPLPPTNKRVVHVLASKDTIAFAILLNQIIHHLQNPEHKSNTGSNSSIEGTLREALIETSQELLLHSEVNRSVYLAKEESRYIYKIEEPLPCPSKILEETLLSRFNLESDMLEKADKRTHEVLSNLEKVGLVRDPWSTGAAGVMVLAGLVPVRWSVRTPMGQNIYRDIKIKAGLWTLDIKKYRRGKKKWTDWDFNFRGYRTVRRLLKVFAEDFLADDDSDVDAELD